MRRKKSRCRAKASRSRGRTHGRHGFRRPAALNRRRHRVLRRRKKARNTAADVAVAEIIWRQLGGNKLKAMVGAYNVYAGDKSLNFYFKAKARNKANAVKVKLTPGDTYDVEFWKIRGSSAVKVSGHSDIYAEDLRRLFEDETGLRTMLFNPKPPPLGTIWPHGAKIKTIDNRNWKTILQVMDTPNKINEAVKKLRKKGHRNLWVFHSWGEKEYLG